MQFSNPGSLPSSITVSGGTIDSVTGSVGSVATPVGVDPASVVAGVTGNVTPTPSSTIANVTTFVPIISRDAYFWPGVSGESLPPTKNANLAYSARAGKACYKIGTGIGSVQILTFPNISRVPYDTTKKTITIQWKHFQVNAINTVSTPLSSLFSYGLANQRQNSVDLLTPAQLGIGWGIYHNVSDGKFHIVVSDGVATKQDIATTVLRAAYTLTTWHVWQVSISDTACQVILDGNIVATTTQGWSTSSTTDSAANNCAFAWCGDVNYENSNSGDSFTEMQITYST